MSTRNTLVWAKEFHLYTDYLDRYGGPHAYLCIRKGLVKLVHVDELRDGLEVTLRLPAEVFGILRPDISKELLLRGRLSVSPRKWAVRGTPARQVWIRKRPRAMRARNLKPRPISRRA